MTGEDLAQMGPMVAIAGSLVAWLGQAFSRTRQRQHGLIFDMAIALAGSVAAGALTWAAISAHPGMLMMFGIGVGGAGVAMATQRGLSAAGLTR